MRSIGIIPARFDSTRFPGKPLVEVLGKPMIQRVYESVFSSQLFNKVVVATDDRRIFDAVIDFGGNACMTSNSHPSGTDRCYEAYQNEKEVFDVLVNIQGDEPFISSHQMQMILSCFNDPQTQIATLIKPITEAEELTDSNRPKVVKDVNEFAIYFSRSVVPFNRNLDLIKALDSNQYYKHIGMYAYRVEVLDEITKLSPSKLELIEGLEQLRWLENGYKIKTAVTKEESYCIDTPTDLEMIEKRFKKEL